MVGTETVWYRRYRNELLLTTCCFALAGEVALVGHYSDLFATTWDSVKSLAPRSRDKRADYMIIEERAADRARSSDNVSIESRISAPAEHAFQGSKSGE